MLTLSIFDFLRPQEVCQTAQTVNIATVSRATLGIPERPLLSSDIPQHPPLRLYISERNMFIIRYDELPHHLAYTLPAAKPSFSAKPEQQGSV